MTEKCKCSYQVHTLKKSLSYEQMIIVNIQHGAATAQPLNMIAQDHDQAKYVNSALI